MAIMAHEQWLDPLLQEKYKMVMFILAFYCGFLISDFVVLNTIIRPYIEREYNLIKS
jgi:hypothetical protein